MLDKPDSIEVAVETETDDSKSVGIREATLDDSTSFCIFGDEDLMGILFLDEESEIEDVEGGMLLRGLGEDEMVLVRTGFGRMMSESRTGNGKEFERRRGEGCEVGGETRGIEESTDAVTGAGTAVDDNNDDDEAGVMFELGLTEITMEGVATTVSLTLI